ncbi:MFS transporter [Streptomyces sp. N50]|uniref:MFS transporter n=1 Tax=Streptomyces sp. N50 TaxID=3081765 RepID=UPI00296240EA|nr:MFS transporter [Streptomyces sp. N50]WOX15496.1 MFS transporter [Streptomyces sp. N50]
MASPPAGRAGFTLLWTSQTFGEFAYSIAVIVLPLLALTITGSASQAGLIGFVDAAALVLAGLPAGAIADRFDRRTVLLWCEAAQVAAFGSLALTLWAGVATLSALVLLALVNGVATAVAMASGEALIPSLVPAERLSDAVALNSARTFAGQLAGTSAGGFLLALKNAFPLLVGCAAHGVGLALLLFLGRRTGRDTGPKPERGHAVDELLDGVRFIARHPFLRVGLFHATVTNLFFGTVYFVVIASAKASGMNSGLIGAMAGLLGVGGLLGALAAPVLQRLLTGARPVFVVQWLFATLTVAMAVLPGGYTPGVLLGVIAFAAPTASAYFTTQQLTLTPDTHRGRVAGVANILSGGGGAIAPLIGGVSYDLAGRFVTLLACAGLMAVVALSALASRVLRQGPGSRGTPAGAPPAHEPSRRTAPDGPGKSGSVHH